VNKLIVARKMQYYQSIPEKQQKPNIGYGKQARRRTVNIRKRKALTRVCVAMAVGLLVISRFVIISEYNYNIRNLERELEELRKENERLELQHARVMDINELEDYALHQLGMVYPDNRDIIYVAVQGAEEQALIAEMDENEGPEGMAARGWFAAAAGKVFSILDID
jgi:cell division protein FtsB